MMLKRRRSYLEEMRADVARREAELAVPLRERTERAERRANSEASQRQAAERALASRFLPDISARTAHLFERKVEEEIARAVGVALRDLGGPDKDITITLPFYAVAYAHPKSVVNIVLERWRMESVPKAEIYSLADPSQHVTTVTVRVPELTYRHVVSG